MKSVLISIQPKWCELIASGKKTVEVRKTRPKIETPFKVYIYCTANKQGVKDLLEIYGTDGKIHIGKCKVIGEFVCNKVDRLAHCGTCNNNIRLNIVDTNLYCKELDYAYLDKCKLSYFDIDKYSNGGDVYGWHISDFKIYDKPKELCEFRKPCIDKENYCPLCPLSTELLADETEVNEYGHTCLNRVKIPPQSWCYVESKEGEINA